MADRATAFEALRDMRDKGNSWNWYIGTPEQLLEAGVIEPYVLEHHFNRGNEASLHDDLGIHLTIRKCAGGRLRVIKAIREGDRRSAKTIEAAVGAYVTDLLSRFSGGTTKA